MSRRFTLTCSANKHVENRGLMDHAEYRIFVYPTGANIQFTDSGTPLICNWRAGDLW
jgi:hypothetical protein